MPESHLLTAFRENERDHVQFLVQRLKSTFTAQDLIQDLYVRLRFADMTMVLSDGGLWASGPTQEVITAEMLERVYRVHARVEPCSRGIVHISVDGAA